MTDRISADDFRRKYGTGGKKSKLVGTPGASWYCRAGCSGWSPLCPKACPICGAPIAGSEFKRPTAAQFKEWERRNA